MPTPEAAGRGAAVAGTPGPEPALDEATAVALGARALGRVLGVDPAALRADTPLQAVGADSLALVCAADALEELLAAEHGRTVRLDDDDVAAAVTLGDLVRPLVRSEPGPSAGGARTRAAS